MEPSQGEPFHLLFDKAMSLAGAPPLAFFPLQTNDTGPGTRNVQLANGPISCVTLFWGVQKNRNRGLVENLTFKTHQPNRRTISKLISLY